MNRDPRNVLIAARLEEVAALLEHQSASPFRVEAYRRAAEVVRGLDRPVTEILRTGGLEAMERLPAIGVTLARAIRDLVETGRLPILERLRGESDAVSLLAPAGAEEPPITELLQVDREYRTKAAAGELRSIAPRRFNPRREAWLPIFHTWLGDRHYTALFSNTARAHQLGKTRDWVVIYVDGDLGEGQYTAVTAFRGPLKGKRIVRGREVACFAYYRRRAATRMPSASLSVG